MKVAKSDYTILMEQFKKMGLEFTAYDFENDKIIAFRPKHKKVTMIGRCHVSFQFDKWGRFIELLIEE